MIRCTKCYSNGVGLSLIPEIKKIIADRPIVSAWEMSTYGITLEFLRKNVGRVIESEFFPGIPSGQYHKEILCQDAQSTSFESDSIELITSNQVFEHIPDDIKAFKECFRILKVNGSLILSIPLFDIPSTKKLAAYNQDGRIHYFQTPEFHGSRLTGPNSILTFWHHSLHDIVDRIESAGFMCSVKNYRPLIQLGGSAIVLVATKPHSKSK